MKPVKVRALEIIEYWSCCVPYHRHTTEYVAMECNAKRKDTPVVTQKERSMIAKFNAIEALSLFLDLESFKLVGDSIELSVTSAIGKVSRGARMFGVIEHKKEDSPNLRKERRNVFR